MPITLKKLFSPTARSSFDFLDETVNVVWAPFKYTGEMQDLAEKLIEESAQDRGEIDQLRKEADAATAEAARLRAGPDVDVLRVAVLEAEAAAAMDQVNTREVRLDSRDKRALRRTLSGLLVSWDVLDEDRKPIPTDEATLAKLPDAFLQVLFMNMARENQPDPTKAPASDAQSDTGRTISEQSPTGTTTSRPRARSASPRLSSTRGRSERATTRSGARGRKP